MKDNLPQGIENKKLREYIYAEKNLFLKEGFETGRDGRQSYIANFLEVAFKKVTDWVLNGANPYDIFTEFRELNKNRGYLKNKEDNSCLISIKNLNKH